MGVEHLIAILLSVFAVSFAVQLVGSERLARLIVESAMASLPDPLRHRVVEECHSEIKEMRGPWPKLYIVLTCFLDAVRLERMWRTEQLRNTAGKDLAHSADNAEGRSRRYLDDPDRFSDAKEDRNLSTGGSQSRKASLRSFAAALKTRYTFLLRSRVYKPQCGLFRVRPYDLLDGNHVLHRTNQKLLFGCGGKVYRLDRGIWVNDW